MPDNKKIKMKLRCNLTDAEKIAAGKELAESTNELEELEKDKAQIVADFKAKITAEQAKTASLSNKVRSGYEFRDVECEVLFDTPKAGEKQTNRLDTGEMVRVDPMTDEEKQRLLNLQPEQPE